MFEGGVSATVQLEDWKKSLEIKELDRTLLALTVDKIYIYENKTDQNSYPLSGYD